MYEFLKIFNLLEKLFKCVYYVILYSRDLNKNGAEK